ncbi:tyrosine-protein phosphatase Lar-like isoform X2 [Neocloeon triangulifer]|uniref:tyrosine-protein phosphatase Lar-like isoform X2 n=1 Tax=Neocloeon triangulifer TaxID=2078957 RepID=UPI00286EC072|nr:tyrosine-protein phosphatase Lar-like isoform X2 [Neocloeon triangulifer]
MALRCRLVPQICLLLVLVNRLHADGIFVKKPKDLSVRNGGIATFYCQTQPNIEIHWRKNGKKINPTQSRYQTYSDLATGHSILRIQPAKHARDDASYECVADNGAKEDVVDAVLTVFDSDEPKGFPRITQVSSASKVVELGQNTALTCEATGDPKPHIVWLKNMTPINYTSNVFKTNDGSLHILNSEEDNQGKYECMAENNLGTEHSTTITLYVKIRRVAPTFSIPPPAVQEIMLGAPLTLNCVAVGSPMPSVKWRKAESIDLTPEDNIPIGRNVLELKEVKETANYTCIAVSPIGTIEARTLVKVQALPSPPVDVTISDVTATSVRLSWSHPERVDIRYYNIEYRTRGSEYVLETINGINTLYYTVRGLSPYTEYEFLVTANNDVGRGPPSSPAIITTGETAETSMGGNKPGSAPWNILPRPLSSSTMVVQWDEPEMPNGQVTGYKVYYTSNPNIPISSWEFQMVDNNKLTTISDLIPYTIYTIRVQAYTSVGPGPMSAPVQVKTQQGVPGQPHNLEAKEIDETSVLLTWSRPLASGENIVSYELYWNDTYDKERHHRHIPVAQHYKLTNLFPNTLYFIWMAAKSQRGEGATTIPIAVRTKQSAPGAPPQDVKAAAEGSRAIRVSWKPPAEKQQNGDIQLYKVHLVRSSQSDSEANVISVNGSLHSVFLDQLAQYTDYRVWVLASTSVGDGPPSYPQTVKTDEDVPGDPQGVTASVINSTTIKVQWQPPLEKDRHGVIRGYHIHVQESKEEGKSIMTTPIRFDILENSTREHVVSGLQPDTKYAVQVAALTRKGDGDRSEPKIVKTPGGVPNRPAINLTVFDEEPGLAVQLHWSNPSQTYGELIGFKITYGAKELNTSNEIFKSATDHLHKFQDLERGVEYEFKLAGQNQVGFGQESVRHFLTPEGVPTGAPFNLTYRFLTPDIVSLSWEPPIRSQRNGKISKYDVKFHKVSSTPSEPISQRNVSTNKAVFGELEEGAVYLFRVRAHTSKGSGPWSDVSSFTVDKEGVRPPLAVMAVATSDSSIEVWWESVPSRGKVIGYQIFYTMTAVEDLESWSQKTVGLTESVELVNLEKYAQYAIAIAARTKSGLGRLSEKITVKVKPEDVPLNLRASDVSTHSMILSWSPPIRINPINYKITLEATKQFVDAQGITQTARIMPRTIILENIVNSQLVNDLSPFTTYNVNVSAIPSDQQYKPPAKITVTTQMAAPQPMVKPDLYGVENEELILVILPQASEEYGPISHYYLIVVPEDKSNANKYPDAFLTNEMLASKGKKQERENAPYIAARFPQRNIPYTYALGTGETHEGFTNRKLVLGTRYKMFVRAVVDTPEKHLYTSSPFSEPLSLDMRQVPPGEPPRRPSPDIPVEHSSDVGVTPKQAEMCILCILGPVAAGLFLAILVVLIMIRSRRRRPCKSPEQAAVLAPLMSSPEALSSLPVAPSDPVEMRRLKFQTPAMMSHPPIHIADLADHIDNLKANDNLKFSQEYESIEPGQQFTWDNSNLEVNRSKNRYANVIAYDHSRVILNNIDGLTGSDYINANYCDGFRKQNAYIATQGPLQETFADFWRMCWEARSASIVMMTRLEERARIKCDQYWPSRGSETYGNITVTINDVQELATYSIRTFQVAKAGVPERREIRQFQFTAWPDHGVPDHSAPFLLFLRRVRNLTPTECGPMVVHCSAGVGRTGCFIVIDSMIERLKNDKLIDIYGHVTCLRAQRNYMVQTEDQYIFIHDALLEAAMCGITEVPARSLHQHLEALLQTDVGESTTGMEAEFKKLSTIRVDATRFVSASLACNKAKNRLVHILPFESSRVGLQPIRGVEGSDFINASFVDGYKYRGAYIATQGPLPETVEDMWRMLWEHNSTIIVMLTKLKEMGRDKCQQYWPSDRSVRYSYFVVDPIAEYNMPQYVLREFKVTDARDGQSRTIRQFQFVDWPEQGVPKSGEGFIDFIGQVHKTKEQFGQEGPITVHCSAGVGRTGVFIALSIVLERMQYEGIVDVFQTVRILRTQRPAMVQTEEQYQFCYRAALEYLGSFDHYAA